MKLRHGVVLSTVLIGLVVGPAVRAEGPSDQAALAKAMATAPLSLQDGFKASAAKGRPISGKYEVEDGALQLSVYTADGGKFYEVIVDHKTGAVAKAEELSKPGDIKEANEQSAAMAKAQGSLAAAADRAVGANAGFRVVSVTPELKAGRVIAEITLLNGTTFKTVEQQVD